MRANRRRDTGAELALRRALWKKGLRYRVDVRVLTQRSRRADVVFSSERIAVFVDGCFWHMCPIHRSIPETNRSFWESKLTANCSRDRDTDARLIAEGWQPIRVWAHEDPTEAARQIADAVIHRRSGRAHGGTTNLD